MERDISHSKITPHEEERKSKDFRKIINGYESMEPWILTSQHFMALRIETEARRKIRESCKIRPILLHIAMVLEAFNYHKKNEDIAEQRQYTEHLHLKRHWKEWRVKITPKILKVTYTGIAFKAIIYCIFYIYTCDSIYGGCIKRYCF